MSITVTLPLSLAVLTGNAKPSKAVQGAIKPSSYAESFEALINLKKCRDSLKQIESMKESKKYQDIGNILSASEFKSFESALTTIVRSDALTADEKQALGTIRRYGLAADAIIMIGGLKGALINGGITIDGSVKPVGNGIEETVEDTDDDDSETGPKLVNYEEVKKYIKLSKDSLNDIIQIIEPALNRK